MLVRLASGDLVEYPDEVGALALADPSQGDVPDFSLEDLNLLISGGLGVFYDEALSLEENIAWAKAHYTKWGKPTASNMAKALAQIKFYKENVSPADVGYVDLELAKAAYGIQSSKRKPEDDFIENMPSPQKKYLAFGDDADETIQHSTDNQTR